MIVKELLTKLGFDLDEEKLKQYEEATNGAIKAAEGLVLVTTAANAAIGELLREAGEFGERMETAAAQTRASTDELQRWDYLSQKLGVDFNLITRSMTLVTAKAGEALIAGGQTLRAYMYLGLSIDDLKSKNPAQLMEQLILGLSRVKSASVQGGLGLMTLGKSYLELLPLIRKGPDAIHAAFADFDRLGLGLSEGEIHNLATFNEGLKDLKAIVENVRNSIAAEFAPAMNEAIARWKEWWILNKDIVKVRVFEFIKAIVDVLFLLIRVLGFAIGTFIELAQHVGGVENALRLMGVAWVSLRIYEMIVGLKELAAAFELAKVQAFLMDAAVAAIPLVFAAVIGALILLAQDFYVWQSGHGKSVFGHFFGPFKDFDAKFGDLFSKEKGLRLGVEFGVAIGQGIWMGLTSVLSGPRQWLVDLMAKRDENMQAAHKEYLAQQTQSVMQAHGMGEPQRYGWQAPMLSAPITINMGAGVTPEQMKQGADIFSQHIDDSWNRILKDFPQTEGGQ